MTIVSKVDLCNMALSHLGNYQTISDIDQPSDGKELTFALWYDISRQTFLKMTMPNFSLTRKRVSLSNDTETFGFQRAYEYPHDCLKLLGIGEVEEKFNNYSVESNGNTRRIYTDEFYDDGLPIRYVRDVDNVSEMSPEFKSAFAWYLAANVALDITQDLNKVTLIERILPEKMATLSGLNAQENMPIRISRSKYRQSRHLYNPVNYRKR